MDDKFACFPFLNPGLYFALQLKNVLIPNAHVFSKKEDVPKDIPLEKEQREIYHILKSCGQESRFIDLFESPKERREVALLSIEKMERMPYFLPSLSIYRASLCTCNLKHNGNMKWIENRGYLKPLPRRHVRGPRRFMSVFETLRTVFS